LDYARGVAVETMDRGRIGRVDRPDVRVMYLEVADRPDEIQAGWAELEERLGSLSGRRFFGAFDGDRYRVCVGIADGDDPDTLGLRLATLPGGSYLRLRLQGEPPELYSLLPAAFEKLEAIGARDVMRPGIEFYRRHDQVDALMPV
jgi:hypothetical protein